MENYELFANLLQSMIDRKNPMNCKLITEWKIPFSEVVEICEASIVDSIEAIKQRMSHEDSKFIVLQAIEIAREL